MTATVTRLRERPVSVQECPPGPWWHRAACAGMETSWWYAPEGSVEHEVALRVCAGCPVRAPCLRAAIREEADDVSRASGLRCGYSPAERRHLRATE